MPLKQGFLANGRWILHESLAAGTNGACQQLCGSSQAREAACHHTFMKTLTLSQEEIAQRAYHLYLAGGCQHGRDQEYWFQAEKELGSKFFTPPVEAKPKAPAKKAAKKAAAKKAPAKK